MKDRDRMSAAPILSYSVPSRVTSTTEGSPADTAHFGSVDFKWFIDHHFKGTESVLISVYNLPDRFFTDPTMLAPRRGILPRSGRTLRGTAETNSFVEPTTRSQRATSTPRTSRLLVWSVAFLSLLWSLRVSAAETGAPPKADEPDFTTLTLEELGGIKIPTVYGASKHEQKITEAPATVSIITRDDFQLFGYRTLADALRSVRGFYVTGDRGYTYPGLRGVNRPGDYGGGMLLMVDGHRLNDPVGDQAFNGGEFPLDVDLIDRVEVIRGPGSSLYGNNAFFGVINVITRRGRDLQGIEASATAASYDTYSGRLSLGHHFTNGVELLVSGTYLDSQGHDRLYYPEFSDINHGWAEHLDWERRGNAFASLVYGDFTLEGGYAHRVKALPTGAYSTIFNLAPNTLTDERAWGELRYKHEFTSDWLVQSRVYFDHYFYEGLGPLDGTDVGLPRQPVLNKDNSRTRWWGGEIQISKMFFESHLVTAGWEGRHDFLVDQENYYVDPHVVVNNVDSPHYSVGFYAQDEWAIRTNLILNAGLRYDNFSSFGDTLNPRAGLIYSPWTPTTFKLLYGQAYRAPNAYEFDYRAVGYLANHSLKPETIRSYELVWEQQLSKPLRLTTAVFYNEIKDQITQIDESTDPSVNEWIFRNLGEAKVRGAEVGLEGQWAAGLRGGMSYTYANATDPATRAWLSNSPRHVAKLNVAVPLYRDKVFAGVELQALSRRLSATTPETTPGFVLANLTLFSRQLTKGLDLSVSIYNLFNTHYSDPVGPDFTQQFIEQDGRNFRVKLSYKF